MRNIRRPRASLSGVLTSIIVAGQLAATLDADLRSPILGLSLVCLDALGIFYSLRAARTSPYAVGCRLTAAGRAFSLVSTLSYLTAAVTGSAPWWWAGTLAGLGMFSCLSAGVLVVPARQLRGRQGWAFFAEIMTVLVAGGMVIWYLVLNPVLAGPLSSNWVYSIGFAVGNLTVFATVSAMLLRGGVPRLHQPGALHYGGLLLYVVGDTAFSSIGVRGEAATHSAPASACLVFASLLITLAALRESTTASTPLAARPRTKMAVWPSHLPYLAVTGGNALMLVAAVREKQFPLWGALVVGQIAMTAMVSLRQAISLLDSRDLSVTDPLTGLANRAGLDSGLDRAASRGEQVAMFLIDLDDFKLINDAYGHAAGDTVLVEFARHLRAAIRSGDLAARIGGDEFAVVLAGITTPDQAVAVARRLLEATRANPMRLSGDTVPIRASIGIAVGAPDSLPKEILRQADVAMYRSKQNGNHGWQVYDVSMIDRRARDAALTEDLITALDGDQLHVLYQPLVSLTDGRPAGVEALLRWQHPVHGLISPLEFIPLAERTGLINTIGHWVLEQACRQAQAWQQRHPGGPPLYASVNISPRQLQQPGLVFDVLDVLSRTGLAPGQLVLEITESAIVDENVAIPALRALREHGIRVAIDDFGTGYSSLQYLTRLPVDILKIDRSFVNELDGTPAGSAVAEAVIRLSQVLNLTTVAEGIETTGQAAELQRLGCNIGQGYLYARPMPAHELDELMAAIS